MYLCMYVCMSAHMCVSVCVHLCVCGGGYAWVKFYDKMFGKMFPPRQNGSSLGGGSPGFSFLLNFALFKCSAVNMHPF